MSWRQWIRTVEIAPALGSADPVTMDSQVEACVPAAGRSARVSIQPKVGR